MKKILIALIVWGAITFINIDLFASSYQGITLDTQLQDLDNRSLRDIFDTGNLLDTFNFVGYQATFTITQDIFEIYSVSVNSTNTNPAVYSSNVLTIGNDIYVSGQMMTTNAVNYLNLLAGNNNYIWLPNINQWYTISSKQVASSTMFELQARQNINGGLYYARNIVVLDLDNLLLDSLTKSELDYYYSLYILLKNGYSPDVFYDQGYNNGYTDGNIDGYNDGNIDGYNDGYTDGLVEGYYDGQVNYHQGNYLPNLDYLEGIPYNNGFNDGYGFGQEDGYNTGYLDGNIAGLETGYNNGYNDGFDNGVISDVDTSWLLDFVSGTVNVLGVTIVPGISLGVFVFIPLFLGFIGFIFRLGGRRG